MGSRNGAIARRNLLCTVAADHVALSIWTLWPVMAVFMPAAVYGFSASDKLLPAVCTFGSWIGFSFTFGQVMHVNSLADGQSARQAALHAAQIAFLGPLLGSLARIYGGRLADRSGGGRVTLGVLAGMILGAALLVTVSTLDAHHAGNRSTGTLGYVAGFLVLFVLSGMGNGSVFKLIPSIYEARSRALDVGEDGRRRWARARSEALIGICSAVGALGGVAINLALRQSYLSSGTETPAYWIFLTSYVVAAALTWRLYVRRHAFAADMADLNIEPARV